jgi:hypothetical protein
MKRREKDVEEFMLKHLGLFKTPPQQEMDVAEERMESRLRTAPASDEPTFGVRARTNYWIRSVLALGTAAVILTAIVLLRTSRGIDAYAVVAEGPLSRVSSEEVLTLRPGARIEVGETIRTNAASGRIHPRGRVARGTARRDRVRRRAC